MPAATTASRSAAQPCPSHSSFHASETSDPSPCVERLPDRVVATSIPGASPLRLGWSAFKPLESRGAAFRGSRPDSGRPNGSTTRPSMASPTGKPSTCAAYKCIGSTEAGGHQTPVTHHGECIQSLPRRSRCTRSQLLVADCQAAPPLPNSCNTSSTSHRSYTVTYDRSDTRRDLPLTVLGPGRLHRHSRTRRYCAGVHPSAHSHERPCPPELAAPEAKGPPPRRSGISTCPRTIVFCTYRPCPGLIDYSTEELSDERVREGSCQAAAAGGASGHTPRDPSPFSRVERRNKPNRNSPYE